MMQDKVFVQIMGQSGHLKWAINRFDSDNTKIILVDALGTSSLRSPMWEKYSNPCMSICAEKKFTVDKLKFGPNGLKQCVVELITKHGMNKFFTYAYEWIERQILELFYERPDLSCKIWFVSDDGTLVSIRTPEDDECMKYLEDISQREKSLEVLQHKLKEEMEEKKNLLVAIEILTQERDKFLEERNKALKEAEELRTERDNTPNRFHQILNPEFTLQELKEATQNFDDSLKLGEGGFGCVYKGSLRRMNVVIKVLNPNSMQGVSQFQQEVAILSQIRHPHLVTLIGSSSEASALVYEFLSNGSLQSRLECSNNTSPLTWQIRTRIIGEICLALIFLHSCKPQLVIHGDLNPNNILLDANFVSKLGDFGISRFVKQSGPDSMHQTSRPAGTFVYCDPHYMTTGQLTPKSDVYSLGILILRLITRTNPLDIARRVREALKNGRFDSMVDESAGNWPFDQAKKLAKIAVNCAEISRDSRPNLVTGVWSVIEPLMKDASLVVDENHVPHHFICPIFQDIMNDPHIAADGFTYEAEAIKQWINSGHNTSPMTNLVLPHLELIPNVVLRSAIKEWLENHPQQS